MEKPVRSLINAHIYLPFTDVVPRKHIIQSSSAFSTHQRLTARIHPRFPRKFRNNSVPRPPLDCHRCAGSPPRLCSRPGSPCRGGSGGRQPRGRPGRLRRGITGRREWARGGWGWRSPQVLTSDTFGWFNGNLTEIPAVLCRPGALLASVRSTRAFVQQSMDNYKEAHEDLKVSQRGSFLSNS